MSLRHIYIDSCMEMWPDADFHLAHRHGVTTNAVTARTPHVDAATALDGLMYWHGIAREHEGLEARHVRRPTGSGHVVRTVDDIRSVKREGRAGLVLAAQDGDWIGHELSRVQACHAVPAPRNIDDEQIRACVARDGVVGPVSWGPLCMKPDTTHRPTLDDFSDHIEGARAQRRRVRRPCPDRGRGGPPAHARVRRRGRARDTRRELPEGVQQVWT